MKARAVIVDALERVNRLSPGETPDADLMAFCVRRLNALIDEWSADGAVLFQTVLTSASQTGDIQLGIGPWTAIPPGSKVLSVTVDYLPLSPLTMELYATVRPTGGQPWVYAFDGVSTVFLQPAPKNQTVVLQTAHGLLAVTNIDADIDAPPGYANALGAALAVRIAPVLLGELPQTLLLAERRAMQRIRRVEPAILSANPLARGYPPPQLLNTP